MNIIDILRKEFVGKTIGCVDCEAVDKKVETLSLGSSGFGVHILFKFTDGSDMMVDCKSDIVVNCEVINCEIVRHLIDRGNGLFVDSATGTEFTRSFCSEGECDGCALHDDLSDENGFQELCANAPCQTDMGNWVFRKKGKDRC